MHMLRILKYDMDARIIELITAIIATYIRYCGIMKLMTKYDIYANIPNIALDTPKIFPYSLVNAALQEALAPISQTGL